MSVLPKNSQSIRLNIDNRRFYCLIVRRQVKNITLTFLSPRRLRLSCPPSTSSLYLNRFLSRHSAWILANAAKIKPKPNIARLRRLVILGVSYDLNFLAASRDSIVFFPDQKVINIQTTSFSSPHLKKILDQKLRLIAKKFINDELLVQKNNYGFEFGRVSFRNQSTRFGSCSHLSSLSFNWQIIFFPYHIFRHIILHELTHLKIKNHSAAFWRQLAIYDPNCLTHRLWLKKHAQSHLIF